MIEIKGLAFLPAATDLRVGDTVEWVNRDMVPHTATDSSPSGFDVGPLDEEARGEIVLRRAGTIQYFCRLHPTMRAALRVK